LEALGGFASTASSCSASGLTDDYTLRGWWAVVWVMGQSGLVIGIAHAVMELAATPAGGRKIDASAF